MLIFYKISHIYFISKITLNFLRKSNNTQNANIIIHFPPNRKDQKIIITHKKSSNTNMVKNAWINMEFIFNINFLLLLILRIISIKNNWLSRWVQAVSNFQTDYVPNSTLRIHFPIKKKKVIQTRYFSDHPQRLNVLTNNVILSKISTHWLQPNLLTFINYFSGKMNSTVASPSHLHGADIVLFLATQTRKLLILETEELCSNHLSRWPEKVNTQRF